jgi:hypothetical protein
MTPWWAARRGDRSAIGEDLAGCGWVLILLTAALLLVGGIVALIAVWS